MVTARPEEPDKIKEVALFAAALSCSGADISVRQSHKVINMAKEFEEYLRG